MKRAAGDTSTGSNSSASIVKPARKKARTSEPFKADGPKDSSTSQQPAKANDQGSADKDKPIRGRKRARINGRVRKLVVPVPKPVAPTLARSTTSGSLVETRSKDASHDVRHEQIMIRRKKGRGLGGYMKQCVRAFVDRSMRSVELVAMSAAIDFALKVALASRDALPGGHEAVSMSVKTMTVDVKDQVVPDDDVRPSRSCRCPRM